MRQRGTLFAAAALAACLGAAAVLGLQWERRLAGWRCGADVYRDQAIGEEEFTSGEERTERGVAQRIYRAQGGPAARYNFINFNRDRLSVGFGMTDAEYKNYASGYGYTDTEMNALKAWKAGARTEAWNRGLAQGGQAGGERALAQVDLEYDTRLRALLRAKGLALRAGNTVESDVPVIVKRNTRVMQPLALAIQDLGKKNGYSSEEYVGAALSLVQTAIRYKIPPLLEGELHTGGILPPARALLSGWGDCDTKTALAASILSNWSSAKMLGVAVPGHYLMAVRRIPGKGDMFVRHEGLEYVLVEPAGPAWLEPGQVGQATIALLKGRDGYQLEPFF